MANGFNGKKHHAVVLHSSGNSGYVVRTAYLQEDGSFWLPNPYTQSNPIRVFKMEHAAQRLCDKLNATYVYDESPNRIATTNNESLAKPW